MVPRLGGFLKETQHHQIHVFSYMVFSIGCAYNSFFFCFVLPLFHIDHRITQKQKKKFQIEHHITFAPLFNMKHYYIYTCKLSIHACIHAFRSS